MNRRIYKKLCKRAMATLIAEHGYRVRQFKFARKVDELIADAPTNMERRARDRGVRRGTYSDFFTLLKGTPGIWLAAGPEGGDGGFEPAIETLNFLEAYSLDPAVWDELASGPQ
jgi:hypothetical protein